MRTVAARIALGYILLALITTLALGVAFHWLVRDYLVRETAQTLRQAARFWAGELAGGRLPGEQDTLGLAGRGVRVQFLLLDGKGRAVNMSPGLRGQKVLQAVLAGSDRASLLAGREIQWRNREFVAVAAPLGRQGALILLSPVADLAQVERSLAGVVGRGLLLSLLLAAVLAVFWSRRIARPLRMLGQAARRLAAREFNAVPVPRTGDEVEELARDLNEMARRLAAYDEAQRRFLQNASHELKTPLMNIGGYAEAIRDGVLEEEEARQGLQVIIRESERLRHLVEEITVLSRLETAGETLRREIVPLQSVAVEAVETVKPAVDGKGLRLNLDVPGDITISADREKLERLLVNLLDNAIRHARSGISCCARAGQDGVVLTVSDDGPGFQPESLPHLFERFYKGSNGQTGLGLAIVKAIAEAHGGSVLARNAAAGGALVEVALPAR